MLVFFFFSFSASDYPSLTIFVSRFKDAIRRLWAWQRKWKRLKSNIRYAWWHSNSLSLYLYHSETRENWWWIYHFLSFDICTLKDYQRHISVLKESLCAKEEHYNMLQSDVSVELIFHISSFIWVYLPLKNPYFPIPMQIISLSFFLFSLSLCSHNWICRSKNSKIDWRRRIVR